MNIYMKLFYFFPIYLFGFLLTYSCTKAEKEPESNTSQRVDQPPNIIWIMADDLGYGDLGSYGQEHIRTPYLDQMAAEGIRFTQFYAGHTVCAPTRSSLMTGQHTGHTPIRGNWSAVTGERVPPHAAVL